MFKSQSTTKRDAEILRRTEAGESYASIGTSLGITRERVRQIAAAAGAPRRTRPPEERLPVINAFIRGGLTLTSAIRLSKGQRAADVMRDKIDLEAALQNRFRSYSEHAHLLRRVDAEEGCVTDFARSLGKSILTAHIVAERIDKEIYARMAHRGKHKTYRGGRSWTTTQNPIIEVMKESSK